MKGCSLCIVERPHEARSREKTYVVDSRAKHDVTLLQHRPILPLSEFHPHPHTSAG
jgi:hypothetical protein